MIFFKSTQQPTIRAMRQIIQMNSPERCHIGHHKAKTQDFKFLHEKLEARLTSWRNKCPSYQKNKTKQKKKGACLRQEDAL